MLPRIILFFTALFIISACSKTESLIISGSSTVLPIVTIAAEEFLNNNKNVSIIVNAGGSGVGINQLGAGKINIGMVSREITSQEINNFPTVRFTQHIIAQDAVVPVVSSEVYHAGIHALSLQQIAAIYIGDIDNWKMLGGPDREILVIDKEKSRGTRHVFMQAILADKNAKTPGTDLVLGSNNEEQTAITQSNAAIGMLSHAWLNKDVKGLAILSDGQTISPSSSNIANGTYPISRNLMLITAGTPTGLTAQFIEFMLSSKGQEIVEQAGYISYSR